MSITINGTEFDTIQEAIDAAEEGQTVVLSNGNYAESFTLRSGVSLEGESEAGVVITGTMSTPADFADATVSSLTVTNASATAMLLDMRGTSSVTDIVFDHVTFSLGAEFTGPVAIGNGQVSGTIAVHDGDDAGDAGLTFQNVTMASNDLLSPGSTAFVYTTIESVDGATMLLDHVNLTGATVGSDLGAQWNMTTPNNTASAAVEIIASSTGLGGNFYISGFDSVLIEDNVFDGQGLALNGVENAQVVGNTFQNIDDTYTANGTQHRGLVIEDAWGTDGASGITVTGNTFTNIDAVDGAIAFQRFTDSGTATIDRLNDIDIRGNTFTDLGAGVDPIYVNDAYFGENAVLPADFEGSQLRIGSAGTDTVTYADSVTIQATDDGVWTVTSGDGTETLSDVEIVNDAAAGKILLVGNGGYATIQEAILAAASGDTLFLAPGTYDGIVDILGKELTVTSGNAGKNPSEWADGSEVVIDRISTDSALTVDGIHVHATHVGAGWVNGGTWEAIGFVGDSTETLTVKNSVLSIDAGGAPDADQGFGFNITYDTGDITIDNTVIGPFEGGFDNPSISNYGAWINGSLDTGRDITITNNTFDLGTPRQIGLAFDGQVGGPQIDVSGNHFGPVGTAPGAVRVFDFGDSLDGAQDYSGVTGNTFADPPGGRGLMTNETNIDGSGNGVTVSFGSGDYADDASYDSVIDATDASTGQNLSGSAGSDLINGSAFNDTIDGGAGDDAINGGDGVDTAVYGQSMDVSMLASNGPDGWTVTTDGAEGTDTLSGVEKVDGTEGGRILLVGSGGYATIQAAIDAATGDDTIYIGAGTYTGNVVIDVDGLTIIAEEGAVLQGTFRADNTGPNPAEDIGIDESVADYLFRTTAYSGASGAGITIQADGVTIRNLEVRGYNTGVELANGTDGASLTDMTITETVNGIRKGSGAAVTDLTVTGGEITDSSFGIYIAKESAAGRDLDGLTITGTSFSDLTQKGIYVETLSDALITGITMTEVGELGRGPAFGGTLANGNLGGFGNGIDINLKWDHEGENASYSNIVIEDFTFTNVGSSNQGGAGAPHFGGAAIAIKARDDGSYSSEGASFNGTVVVRDGTITGTSVGIRVGEPNKANPAANVTGPDVEVSGVSVEDALVADANNVSKSVLTVEMAADDTTFVAQDGPTSTGAIEVTGTDGNDSITTASGNDTIDGGAGNDMLDGGAGADAMSGGEGDDTYMVDNAGDTTVEAVGEGTDTVITADSHTLAANVENLTLVDLGSNTQTFEDMALGPISNGENGWRDIGAADDQGIVDLDGNQVWRISSDPASGDFGGPYSPALSVSAGEPQTTADGEFHSVKFRVKAVSETPDNSRLEVDFANTAGTDRNNFMVIESVAGGGLRIAVNEPTLEGEWSNNSFTAFTGNRPLVSGVDSSIWHDIELRLTYVDGADNDVVQVYLDGALIGTTTTFENYRDALGGSHEANVEANQTARVVFRGSNSGQPTDGPGGQNQGFYFDNLSSTVAHNASGTGNDLGNVITGNSGDNVLSGLAGNDTILGGDGNDTIIGGTGEDDLSGGAGNDSFVEEVGEGVDAIDGGAGTDTLQLVGTDGNDSFTAIVSGGQLTIPGETLTSIENITLDLGGEAGDTLSYAGTTEGVAVDLGTGSATGFTSIAGVENVAGGSGADSLTGNAGNNVLTGGGGNDAIAGGGGVDTAVYAQSIDASMVATNGSGGWTVTAGGAEGTDTLAGIEKVDGAEGGQILLVGNGGFATIQAAIDAASAGDTILVSAGEYEGNVLIDKAVTLRGANAGIDGNGTRGAESVILGKIDVTSSAAVTIDGFEVLNTGATTGGGPTNPALWFATGGSGAGHLVTHTVFNSVVAGGANGVDDRAIGMGPIATGAVRIEDNLFTGASDGKYGTASWGRGIWSDGGGVTLSITGNEFHSTRSAINYDGPDGASSAHLTIEGNTFDVAGTAMSFAAGGDVTGITGNTFNDVDTDFNFQNISNGVTLDLGATDNLATDGQPMVVLGGSAADTITGSVGTDVLQGNGGADTLNGGGGDDNLSGGAGDDILDGGTGADAMAGGADNDTYVVDNAGDVVTEAASAGTDLVQSSIDYTLGANLENLTLIGAAIVGAGNSLNNTIFGNAQDNELNGDAGNDILEGGDGQDTLSGGIGNDTLRGDGGDDLLLGSTGDDILDGGSGIDSMRGGTDNDTYVVDNADDSILESVNQGVDTVEASIGWTLGSNLENLTLTGADNIDGTGNGLANILIGNDGGNVLDGAAGADQMAGGLGDDTYVVDDAGDTVTEGASAGIDLVRSSVSYTLSANVENLTLTGLGNIDATGNGLGNELTGNAGNNTLDGGAGADTMAGGAGDDIYVVDNAGDTATEAVNQGTDTVRSSVDWTLGANFENLELTGLGNINGTGNSVANMLTGNGGDNVLDGGAGADSMAGGAGNDTYLVDVAGDLVTEGADAGTDTVRSAVNYALGANLENLTLTGAGNINGTGNDAANILTGNSGNNTLNGGAGADTMAGGAGNDTYVVDAVGDTVTEAEGEGTDLVRASVSYTLSANVENLTLTGSKNINGTGNALENVLTGNAKNNVLDGGAGADTMVGGAGNDTYVADNAGDVVVEADGAGTDLVQASVSYTLSANVENLTLTGSGNIDGTGNQLANVLIGNAGDNVLDGRSGADTMRGGLGDDTYVVDVGGDVVVEGTDQGDDTVQSSIDWTLGSNLENLTLTGEGNINGTGNELVNVLTGNAGDNVLDGRGGADMMAGGRGDDTYVVNSASDLVTELEDEGADLVRSSVSYTLSANVENLTLTGSNSIDGTGNGLVNTLTGNAKANILDGGAGADTMAGGAGHDTYIVDQEGDEVMEAAGQGVDLVQSSAANYTLTDNVENLTLTGEGNINGRGNELANTLTGNAGDNILDGGAGADNMAGGLGSDTYVVDNVGDVVAEAAELGTDLVQASISYALSANVENLTLTGADNINGTGNSAANVLRGNSGNNVLDGQGGIDDMAGGLGDDTYVVDVTDDVVTEANGEGTDLVRASASYTLSANVENLTLTGSGNIDGTGNDLANVLAGNSGNNVLDGGAGADNMAGGLGNDTYVVDNAADVVSEAGGGGADTVLSAVTWALGGGLENLTLTGVGNINATGNNSANTLIGNSGSNLLDGGGGADTMAGGGGDDIYVVDNAGDLVTEGVDAGIDVVRSAVNYTLTANVENLLLRGSADINGTGNDMANVLTGNAGNNVLDGGAGADTMVGGAGNDTYVVDAVDDVVTESASQGTDLVQSTASSYVLSANVENLTLMGSGDINGTGNELGNMLTGNAGNNVLTGGGGNDAIAGGGGIDTAVYAQSIDASMVATNGSGGWTVTTGGAEGTDTLAGIEKVDGAEGGQILLVGNGGFATIQAAIDAASAGDTILVAAGEYTGNVLIDKAVTLRGANAGIDGNGTRGAESVILGKIDVTSSAAVTIDGFEVLNTGATTGGGPTNPALWFATGGSGAGHLVTHTVFNSVVAGGANGVDDRAIGMGPIATGAVRIEDNLFTGASDGKYGTASWGRGIWSDGGGVTLSITGNEFHSTRSAINYDGPDGASSAHLTIEGNTFDVAGTAMSFAAGGDVTGITGNTFNDVDTDFNFQNISNGVTLDLGATDNLATDGQPMVVLGGSAADTITGSVGTDVLQGNGGADTLNGGGGDDNLSGGAGDDILDGGTGADAMAGGADNDTYVVDNAGDVVTEAASAGTDLVQSSIDYTLGDNLENLTLVGAAIVGTGNSLNNTIVGNAQDNELDGGGGDDTMVGGLGNDTYVIDSIGDVVTEGADAGTDLVRASVSYTLSANVENLTLTGLGNIDATGNGLANVLTGNAGANTLDGGAGVDTMAGGLGDDTYVVDVTGDVVTEGTDAGTDLVRASASYTLSANVENLTLTGTADIDGTGNALANVLTGNDGANLLDGGLGADTMAGGLGNDTYVVDNAGDVVTEEAAGGTDTVHSSISYALDLNLENLTLTGDAIYGTGNDVANVIIGNLQDNELDGGSGDDILDGGDGSDTLTGGIGNDTLDGGAGADLLIGGSGNDTYFVDDAGDIVSESGGPGIDAVFASINYTLGSNVENLTLTGEANLNGTGNGLANSITGNAGDNLINGKLGNDTLTGGGGNDSFVFDTPLNGTTNVDQITDFGVGNDVFNLAHSVFAQISVGVLSESAFHVGASATDADQRIIYDQTSGQVMYDADGNGGGAAVQFAAVTAGTLLTHDDFFVL